MDEFPSELEGADNQLETDETYEYIRTKRDKKRIKRTNSLTLFKSDKMVISSSRDKRIAIWENEHPATGQFVRESRIQNNWINAIEIVDDQILSGSEDGAVQVWDISTKGTSFTAHDEQVTAFAVLQNGLLASASSKGSIKIWDLHNFSLVTAFKGHSKEVMSMVVLHNGFLASASIDGIIKIWNNLSGIEMKELVALEETAASYSLSKTQYSFLACAFLNLFQIWNTDDWNVVRILEGPSEAISLEVFQNDILAACFSSEIQIWNTNKWENMSTLDSNDPHMSITSMVAVNEKNLACGFSNDEIVILDTNNWETLTALKTAYTPESLAVLSNGFLLNTSESDTFFTFWDTKEWSKVKDVDAFTRVIEVSASTVLPNETIVLGLKNGDICFKHKFLSQHNTRLNDIDTVHFTVVNSETRYQDSPKSGSYTLNSSIRVTDPSEKAEFAQSSAIMAIKYIPKIGVIVGTKDREIKTYRNYSFCYKRLKNLDNSLKSPLVLQESGAVFHVGRKEITIFRMKDWSTSETISLKYKELVSVISLRQRKLIGGFQDGSMTVWDTSNWQRIKKIEDKLGDNSAITVFAVLAKYKRLAVGHRNGKIKIWDTHRWVIICDLEAHSKPRDESHENLNEIPALLTDDEFSSNSSFDDSLKSNDVSDDNSNDEVSALTELNEFLISSSYDGTIKIWNSTFWNEVQTLGGNAGQVGSLAVLFNKYLASGYQDGTIIIWNTTDWSEHQRFKGHEGYVNSLTVFSNGFLASGSSDGVIKVWDNKDWKEYQTQTCKMQNFSYAIKSMLVTRNDSLLCVSDKLIQVWDCQFSRDLYIVKGYSNWVTCFAYLNNSLLVSGSSDSTIKIWDPVRWREIRTLSEHEGAVNSLAVVEDRFLVSGSSDGAVIVWDASEFGVVRKLTENKDSVNSLSASKDILACGSEDRTIRVWNTQDWNVIRVFSDLSSSVSSLVFVSDNTLASGSEDGTISFWNTETAELIKSVPGHDFQVSSLAFFSSE